MSGANREPVIIEAVRTPKRRGYRFATGAILFTKILYELERRDGCFGLVTMCIGFGQGTATIIERV